MDAIFKKCNSCKEVKSHSEFEKNIRCHDGVVGQCKDCRNKRRNARAKEPKKKFVTCKICSLCVTEKSIDNFHKCRHTADGFAGWCKSCASIKGKVFSKKWYERELEKDSITHKLRYMLNMAKGRAKKQNLPFDIDIEYLYTVIREDGKCPALGIDIDWNVRNKVTDNSPTLDKIFPQFGYVRGNVAIISRLANTIKSNATSEQLFAVAEWLAHKEKRNV